MYDKCNAQYAQFVVCCGAATITNIYSSPPEDVLSKYILTRVSAPPVYNYTTRKYDGAGSWRLNDVFVLFGGPDFTLKEEADRLGHGGPKKLADYIRTNSLGTVLETSHKWNPMHSERKAGEGDLVIYIWEIDGTALKAWRDARNPPAAKAPKKALG